jgi:DNA-binding MurR/RpiR family transcriptional regulator
MREYMNTLNHNFSGSTINERVGQYYSSLSKSHKKTADYVVSNAFRAATMSIDELANAVGISNATANRFARALGFDGYPQFRAELVSGFESMLAPIDNLRTEISKTATSAEVISRTLQEDINNIEATRHKINPEVCEKVVKLILEAEHIYIVGYGASAFLGGLMGHGLSIFRPKVQYSLGSGGPAHSARHLFRYTPKDLVIGIGFPRYATDTTMLLTQVKSKKIPIIAITDVPSSPLAQIADYSLYAQTNSHYSANSESAVLTLIEALCSAVAHQAESSIDNASEMAEFMLPWLHHNKNYQIKK